MVLTDTDREQIRELTRDGLPLKAYGIAGRYGPLRAWRWAGAAAAPAAAPGHEPRADASA